jgi:hypothetical protein
MDENGLEMRGFWKVLGVGTKRDVRAARGGEAWRQLTGIWLEKGWTGIWLEKGWKWYWFKLLLFSGKTD